MTSSTLASLLLGNVRPKYSNPSPSLFITFKNILINRHLKSEVQVNILSFCRLTLYVLRFSALESFLLGVARALNQCFSTFVRPRPGKFFFHKTRTRSQQIYS